MVLHHLYSDGGQTNCRNSEKTVVVVKSTVPVGTNDIQFIKDFC